MCTYFHFQNIQMRFQKEVEPIAPLSLSFYWKISEDLHRNAAGGQPRPDFSLDSRSSFSGRLGIIKRILGSKTDEV